MIDQVGGMREPQLLKKADIETLFELAEILNSIYETIIEVSAENSIHQTFPLKQSNSKEVELIPSSHSSSEENSLFDSMPPRRPPIRPPRPRDPSKVKFRGKETSFSGGGKKPKTTQPSTRESLKIKEALDVEITKTALLKVLAKNTFCFQKDTRGRFSSATLRKWMIALKTHCAFLTMATGNTKFLEFKTKPNPKKMFRITNIKQSNVNEQNMGEIIKKLLNFDENSSILINRKFPLEHDTNTSVRNTWNKDLYKMPSKTKCGFIRYNNGYAITTPHLLIVLEQRMISINFGRRFFNMCVLKIIRYTGSMEEQKEAHKYWKKFYDRQVTFRNTTSVKSAPNHSSEEQRAKPVASFKQALSQLSQRPEMAILAKRWDKSKGTKPGPYDLVGLSDLDSSNNNSSESGVLYTVPNVARGTQDAQGAQDAQGHGGPRMRPPSVVESNSSSNSRSSQQVLYASVNHGSNSRKGKSKQKAVHVKVGENFFGDDFQTNSIKTKNLKAKETLKQFAQGNSLSASSLAKKSKTPKSNSPSEFSNNDFENFREEISNNSFSLSSKELKQTPKQLSLHDEIMKLVGGKLNANDSHGTFTLNHDIATKKLIFEYRFKAFTFDQKVADTDLENKLAIAIRKVDKSKQINVFTLKGPNKKKLKFNIVSNKLVLVESSIAGKKKKSKKGRAKNPSNASKKPKAKPCGCQTQKKKTSSKGKTKKK